MRRRQLFWLGWLESKTRPGGIEWLKIPDLVHDGWLDWITVSAFVLPRLPIVIGLVVFLWRGMHLAAWGGVLSIASVLAVWVGTRGGKLDRLPDRKAVRLRVPRSGLEWIELAAAVFSGVTLRAYLLRHWLVSLPDHPDRSYRAARRATWVELAVAAYAGVPLAVVLSLSASRLLWAAAGLSALALLIVLFESRVVRLKVAEWVIGVPMVRPVGFHRLLADAARRDVLAVDGSRYVFRDEAVRARAAAVYEHDVTAYRRTVSEAIASPAFRLRTAALELLRPSDSSDRVQVDLALGFAAGVYALWVSFPFGLSHSLAGPLVGKFLVVLVAAFFLWGLLSVLAEVASESLRWSLWVSSVLSGGGRAVLWLVTIGAVMALAASAGFRAVVHGSEAALGFLLPAVMVAAVGGWACRMTARRYWESESVVLKRLSDVAIIAVTAAVLLNLFDRQLMSAQASAGLLFPVVLWRCRRIWRHLHASPSPAVRATADLAVSLLLGASIVLLFVWLANLLRLPSAEVEMIRETADRAGTLIDLPAWAWVLVYAVVVAVQIMLLRHPLRLRWFERWRIARVVDVSRRVLTGGHFALLTVLVVGVAAPVAVEPGLRAQLRTQYTEVAMDTMELDGEVSAYQQIAGQFSGPSTTHAQPLAVLLRRVEKEATPPFSGRDDAVERDLLRRLGELQARAVAPPGHAADRELVTATVADNRSTDGIGPRLRTAAAVVTATDTLDRVRQQNSASAKRVHEAAELAAVAVAKALEIPEIAAGHLVEIVREYLENLIESGRLRDVFAAWTAHLVPDAPVAATVVIPDPQRLEAEADREFHERAAATSARRGDVDAVERRIGTEAPIDAVVDLTAQVRSLELRPGHVTRPGVVERPEPYRPPHIR